MDLKKEFQTYYVSALKRYADFKGRTSRKAYWMFVLFNVLLSWAAIAVDNMLGTADVMKTTLWGIHYGAFYNLYGLVLLVPGLAICVRRLHDTGREWTYMFMLFIPIYGWIWMLIQLIKEGDTAANDFGPIPVDGDTKPTGHPYAPNQKPEAGSQKAEDRSQNAEESGSFDVSVIRKEAEETIAEKPKTEKKEKPKVEKVDRTVKRGRDRGAIDFTQHQNEKRKT